MKFPRFAFLAMFTIAVAGSSSQFRDSLDLTRLIADETSLSRLIIEYDRYGSPSLFVYGDGRVVRQSNSQPGALLPTCTGRVPQTRIKQLLRGFLEHHFFDLPQKSYLVIVASDDPWEDMKLHSIIFDDKVSRAQRTFAYGTYGGNKEPVPTEFSESERLLEDLEREAIATKPCGIGPRIQLPKADPAPPKQSLQHQKM
jgi:hypothetical protein